MNNPAKKRRDAGTRGHLLTYVNPPFRGSRQEGEERNGSRARGRKERHDRHPSYFLGQEGSSKEQRGSVLMFIAPIYDKGDFLTCPIGPGRINRY